MPPESSTLPCPSTLGSVTESVLSCTCIDGKVATLHVRADQNEFQLATEEVDITPAQIEDVPVELTGSVINSEVDIIEAGIIQEEGARAASDSSEISDLQEARTQVDVIGARAKSRRVQEEIIRRVNIVPVVEPLAGPEGDLRHALDDVLHLHVALCHTDTKVRHCRG